MGCKEKLLEQFKDLRPSEVQAILDELDIKQKKLYLKSERGESIPELMREAAVVKAEEMRMAASDQKRRTLKNIIAKRERIKAIDTFDNAYDGIEASLVGNPRNVLHAQESADALGKSIEAKTLGDLHVELEKDHEGIFKLFKSDKFDDDIGRELFEPGSTKNPDAMHVASVYDKYKEILRKSANEAGASIKKMTGHIIAQTHDSVKLQKAGIDKWIRDVLPLLNTERTFGDADPSEFLRTVYANIKTGIHGTITTREQAGIKTAASLSKYLSRERQLHFKSADAFLAYNKQYGMIPSVIQGLEYGLSRMSKEIGLMKMWGANPEANLESVIARYARITRKGATVLDKSKQTALKRRFEVVSGMANVPENPRMARIFSSIRHANSMAFLGFSQLTSITDIPTAAANANYHGIGLLSAYAQIFERIFKGRPKGVERDVTIKLLGEAFDGIRGSAAARFTALDSTTGRMASLANTFFKLNRLQWWTDLMKEGHAMMLSSHLADNMNANWKDMDVGIRNGLLRHGITESKWDIIKQSKTMLAKGREYITPDAIRDMPDEIFPGTMSKDKLRKFKESLEDNLRAFFVTEVNYGVITPGAREAAKFTAAGKAGTIYGETLKAFFQFKMFPMAMATRIFPRLREQGVPGIAHFIISMTVFGYASTQLKDLAKGKGLRDPRKPQTMIDAFLAGGALSMYGDFILKDYNRYGGGLLQTIGGPTFGLTEDLLKMVSFAREGNLDAASDKFIRTVTQRTPFVNLFYTKAALDYILLYGIQESLNSGYLERTQRKMKEEYGQEYLVRPSEFAIGVK